MSHRTLRCEKLTFGYVNGPRVLDGATLAVAAGRRLAVMGANGSGKSTLLSCLAGGTKPDAGSILVDDRPLVFTRSGLRRHRQEVQLVLQDPDDQLFSADVTQDVSFGPMNLGLSEVDVRQRVDEAMQLLGVEHLRRKPTHQLSFGEKKRVAIAGAVAMRPCILLLDEPTAGLDPYGVDEMVVALGRLEQHDTTVVIATHDVAFAVEWADDVAVMQAGGVLHGSPTSVLGDESVLSRARLKRPWSLELASALAGDGLIDPRERPRTTQEVRASLLGWRRGRGAPQP